MSIEQAIVQAWARQLTAAAVAQVRGELMAMNEGLLSGDDSGLLNVWEEVCAQVQGEESIFWETYLEVLEDRLRAHLSSPPNEAELALWIETSDGYCWMSEHRTDAEGESDAPFDREGIVRHLQSEVLEVAGNDESPRVRRYLARQEGWDDDSEDDPDDENDDDENDEIVDDDENDVDTNDGTARENDGLDRPKP